LEDNGFRETNKYEPNIIWSNWSVPSTIYNVLPRYTKINHFPNSIELTRKDNMYKNISRLQLNYGRHNFDFIPQSYLLPNDSTQLSHDMNKDPNKYYIVKPTNKSQGKGI